MLRRLRFAGITLCASVVYLLAGCTGSDPVAPTDPVTPPSFSSLVPSSSRVETPVDEPVHFEVRVEASEGPVTVAWAVDGVERATGSTFDFRPAEPGEYRVEAIASSGGVESRHAWTVAAHAPPPPQNQAPTAELLLDPTSGTAPLDVRLRVGGADPDGGVARYRLQISGATSLSIERSAPIDTTITLGAGDYQVTGTVEDDAGETDASTGTVSVDPPPNRAPVPDLVVNPTSGMAPLDVTIEGDGSDPDGRIVRYALDVDGDGVFDIDADTPLVQTIRYTEARKVWVRLEVTDDRGAVSRDSTLVRVSAANPPPPPQNQAPTLTLEVTPTSGEAPLAIHAKVAGSDADGSVASASIDFDGDGTADTTASAAALEADFTYDAAGDWTIVATVIDDAGASATATVVVSVTAPPDGGGQDSTPNSPPTGSLTADRTSGDAALAVSLSGTGSDADGTVASLEIDPDDGSGFVATNDGRLDVAYPFRDTPYRPRIRITDDAGASTIVDGPAITVYRPVDGSRSTSAASGNPRFDGLEIAPAAWADGRDRLHFTVTVRDHAGDPLPGVPVRVHSLRSNLVAPDGTDLGDPVTVTLDASTTDASGRLSGSVTTRTSTRVEGVPNTGTFVAYDLAVEADAGHGDWRALPDVRGLNAETVVDGTHGVGQFYVKPAGLTCVGQPLEIHVRAFRRSDAPGSGSPADGMYTEIRYAVGGELLAVKPRSGYASWRTDSAGWIKFDYTPQAPDSKTIRAWVDGQPLNITAAIAAVDCP